jgi:hypothetical protein
MKSIKFAVIAMLISIISGCASIVDGSTQLINIQSSPQDAEVSINGTVVGVTPLSIEVKRLENSVLKVSKEGFKPQELTMATKLNGTFWGNVVIGGVFGSTTDKATGASIEYSPNSFNFQLEEVK